MSTAIAERRPLGPWGVLRKALLLSATAAVFSVGLGVFAVAGAVTLLRARRFYTEVLACAVGRILLRIWGVELVVHRDHPVPAGQVVYIANHTSTLDLLILLALRLHDARFFLAGKYRRVPPVGFPAWLCGTFFTVPQDRPAERVKIFQDAGRVLRATGESVFLTPEGTRVLGGRSARSTRAPSTWPPACGRRSCPCSSAFPRRSTRARGSTGGRGGCTSGSSPPSTPRRGRWSSWSRTATG